MKSVATDLAQTQLLKMISFGETPTIPIGLNDPSLLLILCDDDILIAVKIISSKDLLNLVREKRLPDMLLKLKSRAEWSYLLVIGNLTQAYNGKLAVEDHETGWSWNALQGAYLSIQELCIGLVSVGRETHVKSSIEAIANRDRTANRVRPVREALFVSHAEDLLMSLPDIGDQRCEALLRETNGSAAYALMALTDPDHQIAGIGPETKAKCRKALGLAPDMMLALVINEATNGSTNDQQPEQQLSAA